MPTIYTEIQFEAAIEAHLLSNGYVSLPSSTYDRQLALFPDAVLSWIQTTQPKEWERLEKLHGAKTGNVVLSELAKWCDMQGSLSVLRHGFKCYGVALRMATFAAAHDLNADLRARYEANILGLTRQLRYSTRHDGELDLAISLNGLPVLTCELKNPLTGTTVEDAKKQYMVARDPHEKLFEFKKRALVHFAVDSESVAMTTRLAKDATYFLPFNRGCDDGAGNPPNPFGYRTAYLWEQVWERGSLLDILSRFLHLQVEEKRDAKGRKVKRETMIFPRYHQLDAVRTLEAAAKIEGPGHNYLIEHSAGSGKSNTLAWLAHRLASLHDSANERVFDSVLVVTDRVVLDRQLQDTIYQFEHRQGVVQKIDQHTGQLLDALENRVPIVITTLQKFSHVTEAMLRRAEKQGQPSRGVLPTRKLAVIVDEAHSSQGGESATDLKEVLGGEALYERAEREAQERGDVSLTEVLRAIAERGQQENLSFFAFTATPKHKTFAIFGRDGQHSHRYTMRQAIEERFIMDVLKNYVTYDTFFRLAQAGANDPHVERRKAAKALAQFMRLHPENIAQKVAVMLDHFWTHTRHKIGGAAKAMVVTDSRLAAVEYKLKFDAELRHRAQKEPEWAHIKTLVAFSGEVISPKAPGHPFTEEGMNSGIREKELPERFAEEEFQILLVADKYQTGFDQPLLHTMYVDKRLDGVQAVQTLSRLNRIHPLKEDTFVLDFVNTRDDIHAAFKGYYEGAVMGENVEPTRLYELQSELDASGLYTGEEVEAFCRVFFQPKRNQNTSDHAAINAALDPAVGRFKALLLDDDEGAEKIRKQLTSFLGLYAYLSQIIPFGDTDLERLYSFSRFLNPKLPHGASSTALAFDDDVRLEYYRLQKISEGSILLRDGEARPLRGPQETGTGGTEEEIVPLSRLIGDLNDRLGTNFSESDRLFFEQIVAAGTQDEALQDAAAANPFDKFELVAGKLLDSFFLDRIERNEEQAMRFLSDTEFRQLAAQHIIEEIYRRLQNKKPNHPL